MKHKTLALLFLAQFANAATPIKRFEDIEIGMKASSVIGELVQQGYSVSTPVEGAPGRIVKLDGRLVGVFYVGKDGQVEGAEKNVYSVDQPSKHEDVIEFAEALFWLVKDEGEPVKSDSKDQKAASVAAVLTADEIESRLPGQTFRRIFIETKSGAKYRLTLYREGGKAFEIGINQLAPFPAK